MTDGSGMPEHRLQRHRPTALGWSETKASVFLDMLAATCNVSRSAAHAGVDVRAAYRRRRLDPAFAEAWRAAILTGYERLEEQLLAHVTATGLLAGEAPASATPPGPAFDPKLAMDLLRLHRATVESRPAKAAEPVERVSRQEAEDALNRKLDALATRLAAERKGGA